jgi:hypothetical protein
MNSMVLEVRGRLSPLNSTITLNRTGLGDVAQMAEHLPSKHKGPQFNP